MNDLHPSESESAPTTPEDPRLSFAQMVRLHDRVRHALREMRDELDSPAVQRVVRSLEEEHKGRVATPLDRLRVALDEAVATSEATGREVASELTRFSAGRGAEDEDELPPGLARFVAERSSFPGFRYETTRDPLRGWVLRWREVLEDGSMRAGGILYERPHAWMGD